jgi:ATP-dependent DNA helicase RecG
VPEFTVNPSDIMVKFTAPEDRVVHGPGKVTDGVTDAERRILDELIIDGLFLSI